MTYLCVPLMSEIHFVLNLWLGQVPDYACNFTILVLAFGVVACSSTVVMIVVHATGKIKKTSIFNGTLYILVIPFTYIAYCLGADAWVPFAYNVAALFITSLVNTYFMTTYIPHLSLTMYISKTITPCVIMFGFVAIFSLFLHNYMVEGWIRFLMSIAITIALTSFISYQFLLDKELRMKLFRIITYKVIRK